MCVQAEDKLIYEGENMTIVDPPDIPFHSLKFIWPEPCDEPSPNYNPAFPSDLIWPESYDEPIYGNGFPLPSEDCFVPTPPSSEPAYGRYKILKYEKWPSPESDEEVSFNLFGSTACYRGYIGIWKIEGSKLYLIGREDSSGIIQHEPVFARWYSGKLEIPKSKDFFDLFQAAIIFKKILEVHVEHGSVVSQQIVDNSDKFIF